MSLNLRYKGASPTELKSESEKKGVGRDRPELEVDETSQLALLGSL